MSYVDLNGYTRWSEQQHVRRTEAMVREHWTKEEEDILMVKVLGAAIEQNILTAQDLADIAEVKALRTAAQTAGAAARVDAMRLHAALDYEEAQAALAALPAVEDGQPDPVAAQRAGLQTTIDEADEDTLELVAARAAARIAIST